MKFVINRPLNPAGLKILEGNKIFVANDNNPANYIDELSDADAFIIRAPLEKFTAELISQCKKLRVIARAGVGYDMIDVKAANARGIPVVITPGTNARSVAEHSVALMLALSQNIVEGHNATLKGNWAVRDAGKTFELSGKTAGIIGTGAIGSETAKICETLGMKIIACNSHSTREDLEALLKNSDVVSLHAPITEKTRGMIGAREFSLMKHGAILINCARAALVDNAALIDALKNKKIFGAGIDVFDQEPPDPSDELLRCENVIVSPHSAALSREASEKTAEMCARGCLAVLNGEDWPFVAI